MSDEKLTQQDLDQCTGTEEYHKLSAFGKFNCTDGVFILAEKGKAYWLIDAIASYQIYPAIKNMEFQAWTLTTDTKKQKAVLTLTDGNENTIKQQKIAFTDFPLPEVKMYLTNNVLLLANEY